MLLQFDTLHCQQEEREDKGKSMVHILKGSCQAEATSNREKIMSIAIAIIELCLSEGIRQLVSQSVSQIPNIQFYHTV